MVTDGLLDSSAVADRACENDVLGLASPLPPGDGPASIYCCKGRHKLRSPLANLVKNILVKEYMIE